jgi:hypothetical protein
LEKYASINLSRKILRYAIAVILTAIIIGTAEYLSNKSAIANKTIDYSKIYMYQRSWMEVCGLILSMMLLPVLLYALVKQFILRSNENYWINAFLFLVVTFSFFALIAGLTWGIDFDDVSISGVVKSFSPFILFPFILIQLKKVIKPLDLRDEFHNN